MKVYIGPYENWISPYHHFDWLEKHIGEEHLDKFVDIINPVYEVWNNRPWNKRKIKVKIHDYDTWSMDSTLSHIILPMLRQLKETKHGAPYTEDSDVPLELKSTSAKELTDKEKETGHTDESHFKRWDYILDEIIWSFEQQLIDWEEQYYSGEHDHLWVTIEGSSNLKLELGPKDTFKVDREGLNKHNARMRNGYRLFGAYYQSLWD